MSDPYNVGTVTVANGGTTVTGTNTFWIGKVRKNDLFTDPAQGIFARVTADATSNTSLSINAWPGTGLAGGVYEIIPSGDATTSAARLRDLLAQMSVVEANGRGLFFRFSDTVTDADPGAGYIRLNNADPTLATAGYVDVLDANGSAVAAIIDTWDNAGSADGRGQLWLRSISTPSTFRAYDVVGSVVDGTGYRKLTIEHVGGSGTFADDEELMVTMLAVGIGETGQSAYEAAVEAGFVGTEAEWIASLGGIFWKTDWNNATTYGLNDGVLDNGSSWRSLQAGNLNHAPPNLPTTSNAWWKLISAKGTDGTGTGDVVGPAGGVTDGEIPLFSGTTGKLVKGSGLTAPGLIPDYLAGARIANNVADTNNDIDFLASLATSSDGTALLKALSLTKRLDAAWAVGNNNGGLFSGSKANSTWYHCFAILRPDTGVVDAGFDTSPVAANRPAAYTKFRRLGAVRTDASGNILAFVQIGDEFWWVTPTLDVNDTALGTSDALYALKTPEGVMTEARIDYAFSHATLSTFLMVTPLIQTSTAPLSRGSTGSGVAVAGATLQIPGYKILTSTSRQIRVVSNRTATTFQVATLGWRDFL